MLKKITIDGQRIEVEGHKTVLEAAKENNIYIPSLCDYPGLKPFGGCRLCLVEVKGRKGYLPSCSLDVADEMEIVTDSPSLKKTRQEILELILSEHPNACLICSEKTQCDEYKSTIRKVGETTGCVLCPNNGSCDLQDVVEAIGVDKVRFPSVYRDFDIKKEDPFFDRNYNLCILCGRCVRVCSEVRGASAISFVYRGSNAVVGTVLDKPLHEVGCQFCGACVDSCPTGALSERAVKYEKPAESTAETVCPLCSMGCRLDLSLVEGRMIGAKPAQGSVNHGQACVRGRFVLRDVINSADRVDRPYLRKNGGLDPVSWDEALGAAAERLGSLKKGEAAVILSPHAFNESHYGLKKYAADVLKTDQIAAAVPDYPFFSRLAETYGVKLPMGFRLDEIDEAETIFLMNPDIIQAHPMAWLAVYRAVERGANLILVGPQSTGLERFATLTLPVTPGSEGMLLGYLVRLFLEADYSEEDGETPSVISEITPGFDLESVKAATGIEAEDLFIQAAAYLSSQAPPVFMFSAGTCRDLQTLAALADLNHLAEGKLYPLGLESNFRGMTAVWNGAVKPLDIIWEGVKSGRIKALYCCASAALPEDVSPELLILQDTHFSPISRRADILLPAAMPGESAGTLVNTEGRVQKCRAVMKPFGEAKPDWLIVAELAEKAGKSGYDWKKSSKILGEMKKNLPPFAKVSSTALGREEDQFLAEEETVMTELIPLQAPAPPLKQEGLTLLVSYGLNYYRGLALHEESRGLALIHNPRWVLVSQSDAEKYGLEDGDETSMESPVGIFRAVIRVRKHVTPGTCFMNYLWSRDVDGLISETLIKGTETHGSNFPFLKLPVNFIRGE